MKPNHQNCSTAPFVPPPSPPVKICPVLYEKSARDPLDPVRMDAALPARAEPGEQLQLARLSRPQTPTHVLLCKVCIKSPWTVV